MGFEISNGPYIGTHGFVFELNDRSKILKFTIETEAEIAASLMKNQADKEELLWPEIYDIYEINFEKEPETKFYAILRENILDLDDVDDEENIEIIEDMDAILDIKFNFGFEDAIQNSKNYGTHIRSGYWEAVRDSYMQIEKYGNAAVFDFISSNVGINKNGKLVIRDMSFAYIKEKNDISFKKITLKDSEIMFYDENKLIKNTKINDIPDLEELKSIDIQF